VRAALVVFPPHDFPEDLLIEGTRGDSTNERDQEAVLGHSYLVLTHLHRSVDAKYCVGVVIGSDDVVAIREGVVCVDGEGGRGGCGGGSVGRRLHSSSGGILLGGLRWRRLHLGQHGGVSGGGGNVVCGVVIGVGVVGGHGDVFRACAVVTQLTVENGEPLFVVEYAD
jgi:hypothetical protein